MAYGGVEWCFCIAHVGSKCSQWCAFYDNYSISVLGCIKTNDMDNLSDGNWLNLANFHCRDKLVHQNSRYNWYRPWKLANWKSSSPHQFVCECVSKEIHSPTSLSTWEKVSGNIFPQCLRWRFLVFGLVFEYYSTHHPLRCFN